MKAILTAAWAALLFVTSLPASAAQPEWDARSAKVDYSDLDLTKAAGVSTLEHRTAGAIHELCDEPALGLRETVQQRDCERTAGIAASRGIENAVSAAKQLPQTRTSGTATTGSAEKAISHSSQQSWISRSVIRHR